MGGSDLASGCLSIVMCQNIALSIYRGVGFVHGIPPHRWLDSSLAYLISHSFSHLDQWVGAAADDIADVVGANRNPVFNSLNQYRVGALSCFDLLVERVIPP